MLTPLTHSRKLFDSVRNHLAGNHVTDEDIEALRERTEAYPVQCAVAWDLKPELSIHTEAGYRTLKDRHFGHDRNALLAYLALIGKQAVANPEFRQRLAQHIEEQRENMLANAANVVCVHDHGSWSAHEQCDACGGEGQTTCISCAGAGRTRCTTCGGLGTTSNPESYTTSTTINGVVQYQTHTHYVTRTCSFCVGGWRRCHGCAGSGRTRCGPCEATGGFTHYYRLRLEATSTWQVPPLHGLQSKALEQALITAGPARACALVPLSYAHADWTGNRLSAVFVGQAEVSELELNVKGETYEMVGAGDKPHWLVHPPIFDLLLIPELKRAVQLAEGLKLDTREARTRFEQFRQVPVLDAALRQGASVGTSSAASWQQHIVQAARGLISAQAASFLAQIMSRMLDQISPTYSRWVWVVGTCVATLSVAGAIAPAVAARPQMSLFDFLALAVGTGLAAALCVLLCSPLIAMASALRTKALQAKLDPAYRRALTSRRPLRTALLAAGISGPVFAVYAWWGNYVPLPSLAILGRPLLGFLAFLARIYL